MHSIDILVAIEQLKQLKARYCRAVDAQDWSAFKAVFTPDAVLHPSASASQWVEGISAKRGAEEITAWVRSALENAQSMHHVFMPEIEITAPDTATGIWAMEDRVEWPDRVLHGFGHYSETYRRTGEAWQIASVRLTRALYSVEQRTGPSVVRGN